MTFRYTIQDEKGIIKAGFGSLMMAKKYLLELDDPRYYLVCNNLER